jgi:hypothetical protein
MSRKSQETIGPSVDIPATTESNAFQHQRFQQPFAASDGGRSCEADGGLTSKAACGFRSANPWRFVLSSRLNHTGDCSDHPFELRQFRF